MEHVLPAGKVFAGAPLPGVSTQKYVIVRFGTLTVRIGFAAHELGPEDAMQFEATEAYDFMNATAEDCRYYLFIVHRDTFR